MAGPALGAIPQAKGHLYLSCLPEWLLEDESRQQRIENGPCAVRCTWRLKNLPYAGIFDFRYSQIDGRPCDRARSRRVEIMNEGSRHKQTNDR